MRPDDLRGAARNAYDMWRNTFGLSEQSAMRALEQDGLITLTEDEKFTRSFQGTWGLSRAAAEIAARGRDGGSSSRPVSDVERWPARPDPARIGHVVRNIEELSEMYRRGGVSEEKALRDAAFEVMCAAPTEQLADWVVRIASRLWPRIYNDPGSSGTVRR